MAHAQINITPFSGSETDNFNEFEQLITGAIGVAAIANAQQANFLQLHLKGDALRYFLTLPEATRLVFEDSITALRNRFTQDDLREIRIIKLENQKFNPKTDTVKNFLVKLRTEANKAYPASEIVVAPAFPGREKIGKICKISGENLVFSPQISYIILRSNAVNAVKLCNFTARVSGELTKIHNISALSTSFFPCTVSNLSPLVLPLRDFSLNSRIFVLNLNQIHSLL